MERQRHRLDKLVKQNTAALTEANEKLRQEIIERKQVQLDLLEANKKLKTTKKELRALSKKFMAHRQQLSAANQQLSASNQEFRESERCLRESEKKYRELVETTNDGLTDKTKLLQAEKLKSLGELAGGVAHDFNNVLAAILGRAQLMKKQFEFPGLTRERRKAMLELKKGIETIEYAANDGAETVRRIQEFSRMRADDKYLGIADLKNAIEGAVEFTKIRWKNEAEAEGIAYNVIIELAPLPSIEGSTSELREVCINLINNALDAMPQGGEIKITAVVDQDKIVINFSDTGIGITQEIKDRIFDPFFTTKGLRSTGLGMSVSYGIINRHCGSINVDGSEGRGTTFTITLPLAKTRLRKESTRQTRKTSKKVSILVVEDERGIRELLCDLLICDGHEVMDACDGSQAIKLFRQKNFDMVFTDLGMPGISGWQLAEEIKKIDKRIPVILVTGWEVLHKEAEIKKSGVDLVINKPFRMDQILQSVKEGIKLRNRLVRVGI